MDKSSLTIRVSGLIRDGLKPYVEIFENIVVPIAQRISFSEIDKHKIIKMEKEIERHQVQEGQQQHFFIVYYGLMLTCMYAEKECLKSDRPRERGKKLNIIAKARTLICIAYQHRAYDLIPFML